MQYISRVQNLIPAKYLKINLAVALLKDQCVYLTQNVYFSPSPTNPNWIFFLPIYILIFTYFSYVKVKKKRLPECAESMNLEMVDSIYTHAKRVEIFSLHLLLFLNKLKKHCKVINISKIRSWIPKWRKIVEKNKK